jgi:hypothetical protein
MMLLSAWSLLALALAGNVAEAPSSKDAGLLVALVRGVRAADYRGEREELSRLAGALEAVKDPRLAPYRLYWEGFAKWRRALNGFNETPTPPDLEADLDAGIAAFRAALVEKPDWVEARIGIIGCAGPLFFLARNDPPRIEALREEFLPIAREMREKDAENGRALWLTGQTLLGAPPPTGSQPAKAADTFHRGIEQALAEARQLEPGEPEWIPHWGGAENLMNLAYLYSHSPLNNRDLALAYAEGALVAAPEWHYVREVLLPQIRALPQSGR